MSFDDETRTEQIRINPKSRVPGGIIALALHELLHALYNTYLLKALSENEVEDELVKREKEMLKLLSDKQLGNFLKSIADHF